MKTVKIEVPDIYLDTFKEDSAENILYHGGRGGARSYTAAYRVLSFCMTCEPDQVFYAGRYHANDIAGSVYRQIKICAKDMGIKILEDSAERITLDGGCEIRFESFKDELNLRSTPKTVGAWYEEAQEATSVVDLVNIKATVHRVAGKFLFLASMNRTAPNNPMWVLFKRMSDSEKQIVYACVWDNPFAKGSVLKEWKEAKRQLDRGDMTVDEYNLIWKGLPDMDGDKNFYKYDFLERAMDYGSDVLNPSMFIGRVAGVDLAYGGADFCVYTEMEVYADGRKRVCKVEKWKPITNSDTSGRITKLVRASDVKIVSVDAGDGGGIGIYQDLVQNFEKNSYSYSDVRVVRYVPGTPLKNSVVAGHLATNIRAYDHLSLRNDLELQKIYGLPLRFVDVMASIHKRSTADGRFTIETKADFKKRCGFSPDENDSIVIANKMADRLLSDSYVDNSLIRLQTIPVNVTIKPKTKLSRTIPKWLR